MSNVKYLLRSLNEWFEDILSKHKTNNECTLLTLKVVVFSLLRERKKVTNRKLFFNDADDKRRQMVEYFRFEQRKRDCNMEPCSNDDWSSLKRYRQLWRMTIYHNKSQSNLAKGGIALLSYPPGGNTRHNVGPWGAFGGREVVEGQQWYHSEERWWFPYRLSIAVALTIQSQFAVECFRRSNRQGIRHFGAKF